MGPGSSHRRCRARSSTSPLLPLHPDDGRGTGPRLICLGSVLHNSPAWLALFHLLVSSCFQFCSAWEVDGFSPAHPHCPGSNRRPSVEQFAALRDQPVRKARRGLDFAPLESAIALLSPASCRVDLAPPGAVSWFGRRCSPQHCPAGQEWAGQHQLDPQSATGLSPPRARLPGAHGLLSSCSEGCRPCGVSTGALGFRNPFPALLSCCFCFSRWEPATCQKGFAFHQGALLPTHLLSGKLKNCSVPAYLVLIVSFSSHCPWQNITFP